MQNIDRSVLPFFSASVLRDKMIACSQAYLFGVSGKNRVLPYYFPTIGKYYYYFPTREKSFFLTPFFPTIPQKRKPVRRLTR